MTFRHQRVFLFISEIRTQPNDADLVRNIPSLLQFADPLGCSDTIQDWHFLIHKDYVDIWGGPRSRFWLLSCHSAEKIHGLAAVIDSGYGKAFALEFAPHKALVDDIVFNHQNMEASVPIIAGRIL